MTANPGRRRIGVALLASSLGASSGLGLLGGCATSLLPQAPPPPALFVLDDARPAPVQPARPAAAAPTLIVSVPRAAAGFDTRHIVYLRRAHEIEFFAHSQWVDTPAQMLTPLVTRAVEYSGAFKAVLSAPTTALGELRLDTEIVRLQQEFTEVPSRVRLTLRAVLLDTATRRVVALREFDASVPAASDDPAGGVAAARLAVQRVLGELAAFCAEAVAH